VDQYTKLQQALISAHESEQKLVAKCQSLGKQLRSDSGKLSTLMALHVADQKRCEALTAEIDAGRREKESLATRLQSLRTEVRTEQQKLDTLVRHLSQPSSTSERVREEEAAIQELEKRVKAISAECQSAKQELTRARERNLSLGDEFRAAKSTFGNISHDVSALQAQIRDAKAAVAAEEERRLAAERTLKETEDALASVQAGAEEKEELITRLTKEVAEGAREAAEAAASKEAAKTAFAASKQNVARIEKAVAIGTATHDRAKELVETLEDRVQVLRNEEAKLRLIRENARKELEEQQVLTQKAQSAANASEEERRRFETQIAALRTLIEGKDGKRAALRGCERERATYVRAREVLHQALRSANDLTETGKDAVRVVKASVSTAKREVSAYEASVRALQRVSENISSEVTALNRSLAEIAAKVRAAEEEGAERAKKVQELQTQLATTENQLRDQTRALSNATSQRGEWSKRTWIKRGDLKTLKLRAARLSSVLARILNGTKQERVSAMRLHDQCSSVHSMTVSIGKKNRAVDIAITQVHESANVCGKKVEELRTVVARAESAVTSEARTWSEARRQEASAARELIARSRDVAVTREELRGLRALVESARAAYQSLMDTVSAGERERDELMAALSELSADEAKWHDMGIAARKLKDALDSEKAVVSALKRASEYPLNIHRWRQLSATDSGAWALMRRIHKLQRLSRAVTAQLAEKDKLIEAEEKTYATVRKLASASASGEAAEEMRAYAAAVRDRQQRYVAVCKERTLAQQAAREEQVMLEDARAALMKLKQQYWAAKRKEQALKHNEEEAAEDGFSSASAFAALYDQDEGGTTLPAGEMNPVY